MSYSLKLPILSLEDRRNKVRMTRTSVQALKDGKTKLYSDLKYKGVEMQLTKRGIKYPLDAKLADMKDMLADEMHGIQRLPALLFYHPEISFSAAKLNFYEILNNEPLHDISNHIKNIHEELPHLVEKTDRKEVEATIKSSFNGAEAKNAANYRKSLLIVTHLFLENYQNHFLTEILLSLTEIQQIL